MLKPMSDRMSALIMANFAAAATVGLIAMLLTAAYIAFTPPGLSNGWAALVGGSIFFGVMAAIWASIVAFVFYLAGLIFVGMLTWWALHRAGQIGMGPFAVIGAVESVIAGAVLALVWEPGAILLAPLLAISGAVAGATIWRLGYEREP